VAGPVPGQHRDDLSQLRQRFGSASVVGSQMLFQHDGYSICVYFDGIHAGMEVFVRDGSDPKKPTSRSRTLTRF